MHGVLPGEGEKVRKTSSDSGIKFRMIRNCAIISGIFSLIVSFFIIANYCSLKVSDPLHSPVVRELMEKARKSPNDSQLSDTLRELDFLARKAFFTSVSFSRFGSYVLLASIAVFFLCVRLLKEMEGPKPDPGALAEENDRNPGTVIYYGTSIFLFTLFVSALTIPNFLVRSLHESDRFHQVEGLPGETVSLSPLPGFSQEEMQRNWPSFRGFGGYGIARARNPVLDWDGESGKNILWKQVLVKPGMSSPIVWENRLFLSAGDEKSRTVTCLDIENGTVRWVYEMANEPDQKMPEVSEDTGYAAPTMATDGHFVSAIFATGELVTLDLDGKLIWKKNLGLPENHYGHSSSLLAEDGVLFVQYDHSAKARLFSFSLADGRTIYEVGRDAETSWTSPILITHEDRKQIILNGCPSLEAFDAETGKKLWEIPKAVEGELGPSAAFDSGKVYVANAYSRLVCVDVGSRTIVWSCDDDLPDTSSPASFDNILILPSGYGKVSCFNASTGERYWDHEYETGYYSSPVIVEIRKGAAEKGTDQEKFNAVFLIDKKGVTHIMELSRQYKPVSDPRLGEGCVSIPAFIGDRIFIRGEKHLFCIGRK